jgi:hypothetical protein
MTEEAAVDKAADQTTQLAINSNSQHMNHSTSITQARGCGGKGGPHGRGYGSGQGRGSSNASSN